MHQGVNGMTLWAKQSMFWPGMSVENRNTRASCRTCLPCNYFALHGNYFGVVVDRFTGWFSIYRGKGGVACLMDMMTKLFQDMGVIDTGNGGPEFKSEKFKSCMRQYGVKHRLTSVGFAHANCRAELAPKYAKRLLRDHVSPSLGLDNIAVTRAVITYRNTLDRNTGQASHQRTCCWAGS